MLISPPLAPPCSPPRLTHRLPLSTPKGLLLPSCTPSSSRLHLGASPLRTAGKKRHTHTRPRPLTPLLPLSLCLPVSYPRFFLQNSSVARLFTHAWHRNITLTSFKHPPRLLLPLCYDHTTSTAHVPMLISPCDVMHPCRDCSPRVLQREGLPQPLLQ